jgi:uncharacterized membrane protein YtjA (UPF0391 family)
LDSLYDLKLFYESTFKSNLKYPVMKNYTLHFLVITILSALLGYTGLEFPGATTVRVICLFAGIALMISCLDAVIISQKNRIVKKKSGL